MVGFSTLRELIGKTPAKSQDWLQLLLELTTAEREQVCNPFHTIDPPFSTLPNCNQNSCRTQEVIEIKTNVCVKCHFLLLHYKRIE